ncbi:mRNA capping enzyme [Obba rivulosa]|uniref:mRNA-capping enzyme subunit beta n=1 Tax=Obba rivulosa TaxID=1052685 RepID=A0A8E2AU96_9APHY|nr:mRNA capping enzyme [Obba rivulosa]
MDSREPHADHPPPAKRARRSSSPPPGAASSSNGHAPHAPALPPLSLSILGVEPLDEFIREIADFVHHMIMTRPEGSGSVEVEAKVGVLRDKMSGQRLQLPVLVETILAPNSIDCRFESNMTAMQHKHYNQLLNNLKATSPSGSSPLAYEHLRLVDSFYAPDNPRERERIRVTRDEKTGAVHECVRKVRLGDLDIYSPKRAADWRISVNIEIPVPPPLGTPTHTRRKDRMSYSHEEFVVDLTQVTSSSGPNSKPEILHELEVEVARPEYLLATAARRGDPTAPEHERGAFDELIRAFVNNARILVRNARDSWQ